MNDTDKLIGEVMASGLSARGLVAPGDVGEAAGFLGEYLSEARRYGTLGVPPEVPPRYVRRRVEG